MERRRAAHSLLARAARFAAAVSVGAMAACETPLPPDDVQRSMFDRSIAWAQSQTMIDLYNRHIAGKLSGPVNLDVSCADGGTSRITGTVTPPGDSGVTHVDLTYVMNACHALLSYPVAGGTTHTAIRTTGTITRVGRFGATVRSVTTRSDGQLAISGSLNIFINGATQLRPTTDELCAFTATSTLESVSGSYCERPFAY